MCSVKGCARQSRTRGWCEKHYFRWRRHGDPNYTDVTDRDVPPAERFPARVNRHGPVVVEHLGACWLWTGERHSEYGCFRPGRLSGLPEKVLAHRFSYELANGPIPDGATIDHLCRVTLCVNPGHLEAVAPVENTMRGYSPPAVNARKTHCDHGHPFDVGNTYITPSTGQRVCRTCRRATQARRRARLRALAANAA